MKEFRVLSKNKLRELCIQHNFYTCGSDPNYEKLFRLADFGCNPTLNEILDLATYIFKHSGDIFPCEIFGLSEHDSIKTIASLILNSCFRSYVVD